MARDERVGPNEPLYYLPLHVAITYHPPPNQKLGEPPLPLFKKYRLCHDAASKSGGVALNDMLLSGPPLVSSLTGILLRFWRFEYAFSGDISKFFWQCLVIKEDKNAFRWLWFDYPKDPDPIIEMVMDVHLFGAKSSPWQLPMS